jgi:Flp pilus assembly protein TadG
MRVSSRRLLRMFVREERGAALVEFAIIVALLLVIVFGTIDWSRYFLLRAKLTNAVREGARFGAVLSESGADQTAIRSYTKQRFIGDTTLGTVAVAFAGTVGSTTDPRRVRVAWRSYPFSPATFLVIRSAKTISDSAEFRREQP